MAVRQCVQKRDDIVDIAIVQPACSPGHSVKWRIVVDIAAKFRRYVVIGRDGAARTASRMVPGLAARDAALIANGGVANGDLTAQLNLN